MIMADYSYSLLKDNVLIIEDLKNPLKATVTNSLEQILEDLLKKGIDWSNKVIIQKDSEDSYSQVFVSNVDSFHQDIQWKHLSDVSLFEAIKNISK